MALLLPLSAYAKLPAPHEGEIASKVSHPYGGALSIAETTAQVQTQAQLEAHTKLLRALASEPIIQHVNAVTSTFSPPDVNGLIYYLFDFSFSYLVDPTEKSITGTVTPQPQFTNLRQAVLASLHNRPLMERYGALHSAQKASLYSLKQALEEDIINTEATAKQTPLKSVASSPSAAARSNSQQQETASAPLPKSPAPPHKDSNSPDTPDAPDTQATPNTADTAATPSTPAHHADTLLVLLRYQDILRHYESQWNNPQEIFPQLTELESLDPQNPLVQGALAEVLLQLKRPEQAQRHSDKAVSMTKKYAYLYDTRGEIFLQLQLPTLATEEFTKAIELDKHNPALFQHRAASHLARNKTTSMCQDLTQACLLGDCSGYEWVSGKGLCGHELSTPLHSPPSNQKHPSAAEEPSPSGVVHPSSLTPANTPPSPQWHHEQKTLRLKPKKLISNR